MGRKKDYESIYFTEVQIWLNLKESTSYQDSVRIKRQKFHRNQNRHHLWLLWR